MQAYLHKNRKNTYNCIFSEFVHFVLYVHCTVCTTTFPQEASTPNVRDAFVLSCARLHWLRAGKQLLELPPYASLHHSGPNSAHLQQQQASQVTVHSNKQQALKVAVQNLQQ